MFLVKVIGRDRNEVNFIVFIDKVLVILVGNG